MNEVDGSVFRVDSIANSNDSESILVEFPAKFVVEENGGPVNEWIWIRQIAINNSEAIKNCFEINDLMIMMIMMN